MEVEKAGQKPRYDSFTDWARDAARVITVPVARVLARLGFHPNTVTLLGFFLSVGVGVVLALGRLHLGGWLLAITAPIDAVDGALARLLGQKSRFGAFLDSTLDRLSEAALLVGLAAHYLGQGRPVEVILAFAALAGGMLVSYTRARAEALGFSCKIGVFSRLERVVLLAAGLILGFPSIALWVLAVGTLLTAVQRIVHVYLLSQRGEPDNPGEAAPPRSPRVG